MYFDKTKEKLMKKKKKRMQDLKAGGRRLDFCLQIISGKKFVSAAGKITKLYSCIVI